MKRGELGSDTIRGSDPTGWVCGGPSRLGVDLAKFPYLSSRNKKGDPRPGTRRDPLRIPAANAWGVFFIIGVGLICVGCSSFVFPF
jgi:hypothetical protein